jgi:hypothetical protein
MGVDAREVASDGLDCSVKSAMSRRRIQSSYSTPGQLRKGLCRIQFSK